MTRFFVDNRPVEAQPDQSVLQACLTLGYNLPYFCWHPALGSVGACRQCAIKQYRDEKDTQGKIVMSCMTPLAEGIRVSIADPEVAALRASIIEGLMLNHPHDCPVCDEGGECHLQDMTVMTGHDYRRFRFNKRTFYNQYLGPFLNHEMNRCIQCYRCVRYYREYAGGRDFKEQMMRNLVYFGRKEDGVLESEFAGNLVEICPTGVFTDKTLKKHYTRKWDLRLAPSICPHCAIGCNITMGERYGLLRRVVNRYNGEINGYFLCDRGRFGYEFVNSDERVRLPLLRKDGQLQPVSKTAVLDLLREILSAGKAIGIGSPRASLEGNFILRSCVGPGAFFAGVPDAEHRLTAQMLHILQQGPARTPSLRETALCDAVLILGEDVTQVAPILALALRQSARQKPLEEVAKLKIPLWLDHAVREAVQEEHGPLFIAAPHDTKLDDVATEVFHGAPDDCARLGFAVAHALESGAPDLANDLAALAGRIAAALRNAKRPLIVSGPSLNSEAMIQAAAAVAGALCRAGQAAGLVFTAPEANTFGLGLMEARPLSEAVAAVKSGAAETIIILENDLYRRLPRSDADDLLNTARHVVAIDSLAHATTEKAEVVLPAGTFAESDGTIVSNEGRAQRFFQVFVPKGDIESSWEWLRDAVFAAGRQDAAAWEHFDDIKAAMSQAMPALARAVDAAPSAAFRMADSKIPREPHRYSGRTAIHAGINVSEPKPPEDPDTPFSYTMEGYPDQPPAPLVPFFWSPGWNSIQAVNKFQEEIAGPLRGGDAGVRMIEMHGETQGSETPGAGPIPEPFALRPGEQLLIPLYHIFGSEELTHHAPAVAELSPKPYIAMSPGEAARLQLQEGGEALVSINGSSMRLPVRLRESLPAGVAGLPVGLAGGEALNLPAWGKIVKA